MALLGFLLVFSVVFGEEEPAEKVFRIISPSVVVLQNLENSGTGVLLKKEGLILTNAHVMMSPLPYEVRLEAKKNGKWTPLVFKKVNLIGLHPEYDLALLKIDPKENGIELTAATLAQEKSRPGQQVYAIGNPSGGDQILSKTITSGMLSGVDRVFEGLPYYQISAAINPGNSGGPLCNKDGAVIGLVTWKLTDVEGIGFAIPLEKFNPQVFAPVSSRPVDQARCKQLGDAAESYVNRAAEIARQNGVDDERRLILNLIASKLYQMALTYHPTNASIYYNIGMLHRTFDENEIAQAYLIKSIELRPWDDNNSDVWRELGYAMIKQNQRDAALIAWKEGARKLPRIAGKIYEDLAITFLNEKNYPEAAYWSAMGIKVGNCRTDVVRGILRQATENLTQPERVKTQGRIDAIDQTLKDWSDQAKFGREQGKTHMTAEFDELMKRLAGIKVDQVDVGRLWGESQTEKPNPAGKTEDPKPNTANKAEEDPAEKWILSRLAMVRNYRNGQMDGEANDLLKEIVAKYPDHPKTAIAKRYLKEWFGQ